MIVCQNCGRPVEFVQRSRCNTCTLVYMLTHQSLLNRLAHRYCDGLRAGGEGADDAETASALSYGMAFALLYPDQARALVVEDQCVEGDVPDRVLKEIADELLDDLLILQKEAGT